MFYFEERIQTSQNFYKTKQFNYGLPLAGLMVKIS